MLEAVRESAVVDVFKPQGFTCVSAINWCVLEMLARSVVFGRFTELTFNPRS